MVQSSNDLQIMELYMFILCKLKLLCGAVVYEFMIFAIICIKHDKAEFPEKKSATVISKLDSNAVCRLKSFSHESSSISFLPFKLNTQFFFNVECVKTCRIHNFKIFGSVFDATLSPVVQIEILESNVSVPFLPTGVKLH